MISEALIVSAITTGVAGIGLCVVARTSADFADSPNTLTDVTMKPYSVASIKFSTVNVVAVTLAINSPP